MDSIKDYLQEKKKYFMEKYGETLPFDITGSIKYTETHTQTTGALWWKKTEEVKREKIDIFLVIFTEEEETVLRGSYLGPAEINLDTLSQYAPKYVDRIVEFLGSLEHWYLEKKRKKEKERDFQKKLMSRLK